MDLERCPKCGNRWIAGHEKCIECGYAAIGAGLKNAPKRKKKRAGRYVEPGSMRGLLGFILLGGIGFGCFKYQPWEDDWEMVRAWMGQGRHHSIVGEWEILRALRVNKEKPVVLAQAGIKQGTINFSKAGDVKLILNPSGEKATASGRYVVSGELVAVNSVKSSTDGLGIPTSMKMMLAWNGPDDLIASVGGEALYMRRLDPKATLTNMMKLGLSGGKSGEVPGGMKAVVTKMGDQLSKAAGGE